MTNVVIVESPAKAKTINKYLGDQYKVLASYGHVRNLPKKNGSIDVENDFKPTCGLLQPESGRSVRTRFASQLDEMKELEVENYSMSIAAIRSFPESG